MLRLKRGASDSGAAAATARGVLELMAVPFMHRPWLLVPLAESAFGSWQELPRSAVESVDADWMPEVGKGMKGDWRCLMSEVAKSLCPALLAHLLSRSEVGQSHGWDLDEDPWGVEQRLHGMVRRLEG